MSLLRLSVGAYKTQHPHKQSTANADMSMVGRHFVGVFGGVSGVTQLGLKPEDLSQGLRDYLITNLRIRLQAVDKTAYDNRVLEFFQRPRYKGDKGEWLKNIVAYSLADCPALGATTMAISVVIGQKLHYYNVGDVSLKVYRKNAITATWETILETRDRRTTIRDWSGQEMQCPTQLKVYGADQQTRMYAFVEASQGGYDNIKCLCGDVVVVHSVGVSDNLSNNFVKELITTGVEAQKCLWSLARPT